MIFLSAYGQLVVIFLKLKRWKLLFMGLMLAATTSNLYLHKPIDSWMVQLADDGLKIVSAHDFMEKGLILADSQKDSKEIAHISNSVLRMTKRNDDFLTNCTEGPDCQEKYFQLLLGKRSGKIVHYVSFQPNGTAKIKCQFSIGTELYCPLMAYLAAISQPGMDKNLMQLNYVSTFLLKSSARTLGRISRGNGTLCMTDVNFPSVFSRTLMAQMIFVAISLVFYLLVGTVSCIYELKNTGFLQLMCRRGMPVLAYWLALWTITLIEMAIFAALLTFAHHYQCIGFYPTPRLINLFLCSFLQFCCMAALVILLTVVTRKVVIAGLLACLLSFAAVSCIVLNRIVLSSSQKNSNGLRYIILGLPFGHFAEQAYAVLLQGDLKAIDKFFDLVLPISAAVFGLTLIATLYLDYVLKTGNGLHFPHAFMLRLRYWILRKSDRVWLEEPKPSVMVEPVTFGANPTLCTHKLKKSYAECCGQPTHGLSGFSVQLHEEQITAVVGHNGSGKSALLQILSGERLPTSGKATFNNLLISDPIARYHICHEIGYCPQTDALVDQLTVRDTLKLAVSSSGLEWDGVIKEVNGILNSFQIDSKIDRSIQSLSTSDKRKVCVTMALIGKPKLILLDDPSRDMDYVAKRRMWKLLYEYRKGRVIIFSTLFIDEGDGMADRMIFMSSGRIVCAGSPFFFKRAFDCKFIVQVASKTEFHVPYIIRKITTMFNSVRVRSVADADLELEVPLMDDYLLPAVTAEIENMSELIDEFGIAQYSLDDVFSKLKPLPHSAIEEHFIASTIGYVADDVDRMRAIQSRPVYNCAESRVNIKLEPTKLGTLLVMLTDHIILMRRSPVRLVLRVVVPLVLLAVLSVGAILEKGSSHDKTQLRYDLSYSAQYLEDRGVCISYDELNPANLPADLVRIGAQHLESIKPDECNLIFTGKNHTPKEIASASLRPANFDYKNFQQAISDKEDVLKTIEKSCRKATKPCPILHAGFWCPEYYPNQELEVNVGTYVPDSSTTPIDVAIVLIDLYTKVFAHTGMRLFYNAKLSVVAQGITKRQTFLVPNITAEGVVDIRSIFFGFYSIFVQFILLVMLPTVCMLDVIQHQQCGVFRQLLSMGVTRSHYWLCTFFCHWAQCAIFYILSVVILVIIIPAYSNPLFLVAAMLPTLILGLTNSLLFVYAICAAAEFACYLHVAVYGCFSLLASLSVLLTHPNELLVQMLTYLLPQYAIVAPTYFCARIINFSLSFFNGLPNEEMPSLLQYTFSAPTIRDPIIALILHFVLLLVLLIVLENRRKIFPCYKSPKAGDSSPGYSGCKEAAIVDEIRKLESNPKCDDNIMESNHLEVALDSGGLKDLTIGVKHGEVLGLIGPCDSGKSAAIRAIVGEIASTGGRVDFHVQDRWLSSDTAVQQNAIGFCPKHDPIIEDLTLRENLYFYSRTIGVPAERMQRLLRHFSLDEEADTIAKRASTGEKRRLSLAIAVLSSPRFVALNEPSTGVDPEGRQLLWQAIKSVANREGGILVATQEMEEAEKLCSRICIMTGGFMATITTIKDLILRYKRMYFLEIQLEISANETPAGVESRKAELVKLILEKLYGGIVLQELTVCVQFGIPISSIGRLSTMLSWLLYQKSKLAWLYFSLHYATVDQTMKAIVVHQEDQLYKLYTEAAVKQAPVSI